MELSRILELRDKFWDGECSEQEEKDLRDFLAWNDDIPSELEEIKTYLSIMNSNSQDLDSEFDEKIISSIETPRKGKVISLKAFRPLLVAASVLAVVYIGMEVNKGNTIIAEETFEDTYDTPEEALEEVKKTLMLVSGKMNKGKEYSNELGNFSVAAGQLNSSKK